MKTTVNTRRIGCRPQPFYTPNSLRTPQYQGLPLHMLVAWWVLQQKAPVTVRDVSETFHITPRRASDTLLYLNYIDNVQCTRNWQNMPHGGRKRVWTVSAIGDRPRTSFCQESADHRAVKKNTPPARRRPLPQALRELRTWMVTRRQGETVPPDRFSPEHGSTE